MNPNLDRTAAHDGEKGQRQVCGVSAIEVERDLNHLLNYIHFVEFINTFSTLFVCGLKSLHHQIYCMFFEINHGWYLRMQRTFLRRRPGLLRFLRQCSVAKFTEENAQIVEHFGAPKRTKEGNKKLFTCEELTSGWKSVAFPNEAAGNRAYAFHGMLFTDDIVIFI
jgi:hypothetical protein